MRERPILFSAPMVRAILTEQKTQTRRAVSVRGLDFVGGGPKGGPDWNDPSCWGYEDTNTAKNWALAKSESVDHVFSCPHGEVGDRLYVREAWRTLDALNEHSGTKIAEMCVDAGYRLPWAPIQYEADGHRVNWEHVSTPPHDDPPTPGRYRHARFMPRWASRIMLEITGVRVERLQNISAADAIAEGIERVDDFYGCPCWRVYGEPDGADVCAPDDPVGSYRSLWESINGANTWNDNPWVWAIDFKVLRGGVHAD